MYCYKVSRRLQSRIFTRNLRGSKVHYCDCKNIYISSSNYVIWSWSLIIFSNACHEPPYIVLSMFMDSQNGIEYNTKVKIDQLFAFDRNAHHEYLLTVEYLCSRRFHSSSDNDSMTYCAWRFKSLSRRPNGWSPAKIMLGLSWTVRCLPLSNCARKSRKAPQVWSCLNSPWYSFKIVIWGGLEKFGIELDSINLYTVRILTSVRFSRCMLTAVERKMPWRRFVPSLLSFHTVCQDRGTLLSVSWNLDSWVLSVVRMVF